MSHSQQDLTPSQSEARDGPEVSARELRAQCPQFRILVIGKANAGKTTILQKVCNAKAGVKPIVRDRDGKEIKRSWFKKPSTTRGEHDIEHQITYPGSNFVFHDSCGFEAGSEDELERVRKFIEAKSAGVELKHQLHAIWYCLPMDDDRPLSLAEMTFFEHGTGRVPVILIFTKFDALVIKAAAKLRGDDTNLEQAWAEAPGLAQTIFQQEYLPRVENVTHPPKAHVCLEAMDKPKKQCPELTQQTALALDDAVLQQLFISVQMNNLSLCIKSAAGTVVNEWKDLQKGSMDRTIIAIATWFPHFWDRDRAWHYWRDDWDRRWYWDHYYYWDIEGCAEAVQSIFSFIDDSQTSPTPTALPVAAGLLIITEHSFWCSGKDFKGKFIKAAKKYKKGLHQFIRQSMVNSSVPTMSSEATQEWLYNHVCQNLMPH